MSRRDMLAAAALVLVCIVVGTGFAFAYFSPVIIALRGGH